uniref:Uncharacterized protein n=1 Tax=Rhizophora mucronata TaxID=61149 RepID=A0A2P2IM93_RHIMU
MKQTKVETVAGETNMKRSIPPPPSPPPLPRFWVRKTVTQSVTNQEIAKFWRQKRIEEEDHLLAAIKAAARIRARKLSVRQCSYGFLTLTISLLQHRNLDHALIFPFHAFSFGLLDLGP